MEMPVPVELWMPDQDWLESTEMTVGQSEWPEAADVSELHTREAVLASLTFTLRPDVHCFCHLPAFCHLIFTL